MVQALVHTAQSLSQLMPRLQESRDSESLIVKVLCWAYRWPACQVTAGRLKVYRVVTGALQLALKHEALHVTQLPWQIA